MRRPVQVIYTATFNSRSEASKEEYRIKHLTRKQKEKLIKEKD
jgi:putative endonuclease